LVERAKQRSSSKKKQQSHQFLSPQQLYTPGKPQTLDLLNCGNCNDGDLNRTTTSFRGGLGDTMGPEGSNSYIVIEKTIPP
jgi:hypothetical protein